MEGEDYIRCVWVVEREFGYGKAMRVVDSTHPRFVIGSRFDFGFLDIASTEGYRIEIEPVSPAVRHDINEQRRLRESKLSSTESHAMVEMRWLKRSPVPLGEAECVLQFRESRRYILDMARIDDFDGVEWKDIPVVNATDAAGVARDE